MKTEQPHLQDILIAIDKIEDVANHTTFDEFIRDYRIHDIAMYNFIIVGEASNRISNSIRFRFRRRSLQIKKHWFRL